MNISGNYRNNSVVDLYKAFLSTCGISDENNSIESNIKICEVNRYTEIDIKFISENKIYDFTKQYYGNVDKKELLLNVYDFLSQIYKIKPEWGVLTGVKPTKLMRKILQFEDSRNFALEKLHSDYRVSEKNRVLYMMFALYRKVL